MSNVAVRQTRQLSKRSGRWYETVEGTFPSVTTVLGCVGKPALLNWMAKTERQMCVEAAANLYVDLPRDLPGEKWMSRASYIATLEKRIGKEKAGKKELDKASEIGSAVHAMIEWNLRKEIGQVVGPAPHLPPAASWAFMAWEDWRRSVKLEPLWIEQTVWSATHGYAGTLDLAATIDLPPYGRCTAVLDWKTGKAIYVEAALQNAAYGHAYAEMGHAEGCPVGLIVRLPKTTDDPNFEVKIIRPEDQGELFKVFLHVKGLWMFLNKADEERKEG